MRRPLLITLLAALVVVLPIGAGSAAVGRRAAIGVSSSIAAGQTLTGKVKWTATVTGVSSSDVTSVEFSIDGSLKWTEKTSPYVFNGDNGMLDTAALSNGSHTFGVVARAKDGTTSSVSASATTSNRPANTAKPVVSGQTTEGKQLSGSNGSWSGPGPISFAYQWLRCDSSGSGCGPISGATHSTYTLTHSDVGHRSRIVVTASNGAGPTESTSDAAAVVVAALGAPVNTSLPSISGSARDGSLLTASDGGWSNHPTAFAYQWLRCDANGNNCGPISGANSRQYTVATADVGHRLRVAVTASNSAGSATATSHTNGVVQASGSAPVNTSTPTVSGTPKAGSTLTADRRSWTGTNPITFAYQWRRCDGAGGNCGDIPGANTTAYTLTSADIAHTIRVNVAATNARGTTVATSAATALIAPAKSTTGPAVPVSQVALPNQLVIDAVKFSPNPVRSRSTPIVARFHVADGRGFSIQGALVFALGIPYGWDAGAPETPTDGAGWATIILQPTAQLPLRRGALLVFVRARKPGDSLLAGVSARRLVQERVRAPHRR
jgi:hypothetical protein